MRLARIAAFLAPLLLALSSPALAFTFALTGGSTDQYMTWRVNQSSATVFAANSTIPLTMGGSASNKAGGSFTWTASSGKLTVVALAVAWVNRSSAGLSDSRTAVDARSPPTFALIPEAGEPFPLTVDLLIRVRIVGTLEQFALASGQTQTTLLFSQSVLYNGVTVTSDSLNYDHAILTPGSVVGPVSFPKGTLNNVVLHGVSSGSVFTIPIWAFSRGTVTNEGIVDSYSSYGDGLAIEIEISNANAVAVDEDPVSAPLSLCASPNPARGSARVSFALPRAANVRLSIYDVAGHQVARLADGREQAGRHEVRWNGKGAGGEPLAAGLYVMELIAGHERRVQKLVLLANR